MNSFVKFCFSIILLFSSLLSFGQNHQELAISSNSKIVFVELASFNKLVLKHSNKEGEFKVLCSNEDERTKPKLFEKNGLVHIKVVVNPDNLVGSQKNKYRAGQPSFPDYNILIPKEIQVKIVYDKGNFITENFNGELELSLNHGVLNINNFKGSVAIQSFSGIINCKLKNAQLNIESSKGGIVSNLKDYNIIKNKTTLKGYCRDSINRLSIKTVHAKVNLQALLTQ